MEGRSVISLAIILYVAIFIITSCDVANAATHTSHPESASCVA